MRTPAFWSHFIRCGACLLLACHDPAPSDAGVDADVPPADPVPVFDLDGALDTPETFFDLPFPSDLRLDPDGTPDLTGYPNPGVTQVGDLIGLAGDRPGFSTLPVAYFRFAGPVAARDLDTPIEARPDAPVLLLDVDPDSPDRGTLYPTIASTFTRDVYTGDHLVAVAAFPGIVLHPGRTYAFVVARTFGDADGQPLPDNEAFDALARGETPPGTRSAAATALYAPLFETLDTLGVARDDVVTATVFTTGDVVAETRALSDRALADHDVTVEGLVLDPTDGVHERYCELLGTVSQPQFQVGTPPFDTEGRFVFDDDGALVHQRDEITKIVVAIPRIEMPAGGYPLMVYFHGSGGIAAQVVDRGPYIDGGEPEVGHGPAHIIAEHGIASVGASLPLSPDRLPGASSIAYLNLANLGAFRDTFRQGVIEQRLLIEALRTLEIPPDALAACGGATLPATETAFHFDPASFVALGQSMGGMYTNLVGAVEPGLRALVPTGAGGFWSFFILRTTLIANVDTVIAALLRAPKDNLNHLHPSLSLMELGWEAAEPMASMPRLSRRPLAGVSPRPIYQPVGEGDSFFPTTVYDAMALAYGHPQAGEVVWPSLQASLAEAGLDGVIDYPVSLNLESEAGGTYTGVVVQSAGDGFSDPHEIFIQVEGIRYQWGCFLRTAIAGDAVVPPPAALGTACPTE